MGAAPGRAGTTGVSVPRVRRRLAPQGDGLWHSVFAHGEGSSWHSMDSLIMLLLFCHLDFLLVGLAGCLVWWRTRSRYCAVATSLTLLALTLCQRTMGIGLFELLIGRPWIWLIMG